MLGLRRKVRIETERMTLRLPAHSDWRDWAALRAESATFLTPWEPVWSSDHLSRKAFTNRVYWAARAESQGTALPVLLIRREDQALLGAITLDNIRRGPAQSGTLGYWIGRPHARQGYMREAIQGIVHHAFTAMDVSRIEAAAICRSRGAGGTMCSTRTSAATGADAPTRAEGAAGGGLCAPRTPRRIFGPE